MQKSLSELASLPVSELRRLVEREPVLISVNGAPTFVTQSLNSFEEMVRRIRKLEATAAPKPSDHG